MKVKIDGELYTIKFGDTAGQERYSKMTKSYFHMHDALVVVFDMTDANSLEGGMRLIKQIQEVKKMPLIMVGNKSDREQYRILSDQMFEDIHESTQIPCIQTSAYTG
jgi:small GTP-binding protein